MQFNVGVDFPSFIAWDGTTSFPVKIKDFNHYGFTAKTTDELDADVQFNLFYHEPSVGDPCVPGPAVRIPAVAFCEGEITADGLSSVILPEGTAADSFCAFTVPCRNGHWISIAPATANTGEDVQITVTMKGAMR